MPMPTDCAGGTEDDLLSGGMVNHNQIGGGEFDLSGGGAWAHVFVVASAVDLGPTAYTIIDVAPGIDNIDLHSGQAICPPHGPCSPVPV